MFGDCFAKEGGDGVADLNADLYPRPLKTEVVGEPLKPGRFSVGDGAASLGMEVSARF